MERLRGPLRDTGGYPVRGQPGYEERWLLRQRYAALPKLERLRRHIARPEVYGAVRAPVLTLYHDDGAGNLTEPPRSPPSRRARQMPGAQEHPASRAVAIADGAYVLLSDYVRTDKRSIHQAIDRFLADLRHVTLETHMCPPKPQVSLLRKLLIAPIRGYQLFLSPILPPSCRYRPTCSAPTLRAIEIWGVRGIWMGVNVVRCRPGVPGGYDRTRPPDH